MVLPRCYTFKNTIKIFGHFLAFRSDFTLILMVQVRYDTGLSGVK